tara:strand:- start:156 stop:980 length:825 start_codon:yes stop_codon:yes gene_type:complete
MRILTILTLAVFVLNTSPALAALNNGSPSGTLNACSTGIAAGASCRATPTKYQVTIYEMGLCSEHPFGTNTAGVNGSTVSTMDKSTCSPAFTNTAGHTVDIAQFVNGSVDLVGTSTRPANATYGYPYIILGNTFTVNTAVTSTDSNVYYSNGSGGATTTSPGTDYADQLTNFFGGSCYSGYIGASIPIGTIDGFLTNNSLVRRDSTDFGGGECTGVTRLVGVINLTTPFSITAQTKRLQFNFIVTDYGVELDVNGAGVVTDMGSGPFSGSFVVE